MRLSDGEQLEDIAPDGTKLVYPQDDMSFVRYRHHPILYAVSATN